MRLGYSNVVRYPYGWYGWMDFNKSPPKAEPVSSGTKFPDIEFAVPGDKIDRSYLNIEKAPRKLRLKNLQFEYFLLLLFDERSLESEKAVQTVDYIRRELQCCTPTLRFIGIAVGMSRHAAIKYSRSSKVGYPLLADPLAATAEFPGEESLPVAVMLKKLIRA